MTQYVELHSASAFSFLDGASVPEELVDRCAAAEMPAIALLDRDGVYGAPRFHLAAEKAGVKAHIGAEVSCFSFPVSRKNQVSVEKQETRNEKLPLLVESRA